MASISKGEQSLVDRRKPHIPLVLHSVIKTASPKRRSSVRMPSFRWGNGSAQAESASSPETAHNADLLVNSLGLDVLSHIFILLRASSDIWIGPPGDLSCLYVSHVCALWRLARRSCGRKSRSATHGGQDLPRAGESGAADRPGRGGGGKSRIACAHPRRLHGQHHLSRVLRPRAGLRCAGNLARRPHVGDISPGQDAVRWDRLFDLWSRSTDVVFPCCVPPHSQMSHRVAPELVWRIAAHFS
ncbi:hypothetical protein FB451DRAFT_736843 [Mycena latifolia]|nr:hypothetical protein FB451DRAFT_736843 [Mycena latifolia]